eukprot:Lankesteria_metandrocarpae@DN4949_c0_g1_i5.p1
MRSSPSTTTTYTSTRPKHVDGMGGHVIQSGVNMSRPRTPISSSSQWTTEGPMHHSRSLVSSTTLTGHERVLRENVVEHEIKVPRKRIVEETVEKTIIVPEKVCREEVINESVVVRERIVEVARPIYHEKIVEVPEIEYREKIVEVPEKIVQEKIKQVPRIEVQEHITYVPKLITHEKIVEVPDVEIREVLVEKIVEVPEFRDEVVIKEVIVPRYIEVPVAEYKDVEIEHDIMRSIPLPVECITTVEYNLPQIRPRYAKVPVPIYAPRFIEVAVPVEQMDEQTAIAADQIAAQVAMVAASGAPSLCEIEKLAEATKNFVPELETNPERIQRAWQDSAMAAHEMGHSTITTHPRRVGLLSGSGTPQRMISGGSSTVVYQHHHSPHSNARRNVRRRQSLTGSTSS